jgi:ribosome-associated translation inhibitor RaiA
VTTFDKPKTKMKTKEELQPEVQTEVQKLKVELTVQEWEAVLAVIEQSTSPHIQVKSVAAELVKQLQPQIKDDKP